MSVSKLSILRPIGGVHCGRGAQRVPGRQHVERIAFNPSPKELLAFSGQRALEGSAQEFDLVRFLPISVSTRALSSTAAVSSATAIARLAVTSALLLLLVGPTVVQAQQTRGYVPRACGFDLDDDGVIGERQDDCRICDAGLDGNNRVIAGTLDPDGDGVNEDMIYVACGNKGIDQVNCGTDGNRPCKTLDYAFNVARDGPADGQEDIVCFTGICAVDTLDPGDRGLKTVKVKPRSGNEERDWEFPSNPAMLVGWDRDQDHAYPPYDVDDTAVLNGGAPNDFDHAIVFGNKSNSYFELAHFSAIDYGRNPSSADAGFVLMSQAQPSSHVYMHDLEVDGINEGVSDIQASGRHAFRQFHGGMPDYWALINVSTTNVGGYWWRGECGVTLPNTCGPYRIQNLTYTAHGENSKTMSTIKVWGYANGIEVIDSYFDGNFGTWTPGRVRGLTVAQCSQDWVIRNNEFHNISHAVLVQGYAAGSGCENGRARSVDDVLVENNVAKYTESFQPSAEFVIIEAGGDSPGEHPENITVRNNVAVSTSELNCLKYQVGYRGGSSPPGTIEFSGNRCVGAPDYAAIFIDDYPHEQHQSFIVKNNSIEGIPPSSWRSNVRTDYAPTNWVASGNCYDPDAQFRWDGGAVTSLAGWQSASASGSDQGSFTQQPCPVPEPAARLAHVFALGTLCLLSLLARRVSRGDQRPPVAG
jgi:hypothetical protein